MKLERVTITGADDKVSYNDIIEITNKFPFVEWGILFSESRVGTPRYPTLEWVNGLMKTISENKLNIKLSAHLCGAYTVEFLTTGLLTKAFNNIKDVMMGPIFGRYQMNFNSTKNKACNDFHESFGRNQTKIILQYNKSNSELCEKIISDYSYNPNIHFLYDGSGGRGVLPDQWKAPIPNHFTGYAGGLNPDNLQQALINIQKSAFSTSPKENKIWIDTETGVRTDDDDLDLQKVIKFLEISSNYTK
jgi:phosphoribosylanthranilate isomerase